jgi:hypothetical protein
MTKLNIQGLSRKFEPLMSCLVPDPNHAFVSIDLSAGEPTVTTHFSRDPNYYNATFGMVGKEPYYDRQGVLQIDDIYLMGMSVSPMGKDRMRALFNSKFPHVIYQEGVYYEERCLAPVPPVTVQERSFAQQWVADKQVILNQIKSERAFHKILILGLGYSMGPKHMVESAYKAGYKLSKKDAKAFFDAYWDLFKGVAELRDRLEAQFLVKGHLTNAFGYRLYPDPSYKALNYFIQSSVSGIMNVLKAKFFAVCPSAKYVTTIHDELILQVPTDQLQQAKDLMDLAVASLNQDLNWTVKVRTGWAEGRNMFEAK